MKRTVFAYPYVVWMLIFILAPMLLIVYYAFSLKGSLTLQNLAAAFDPLYMQVLLRSVLMALYATAICLLLGYPVAYMLSTMKRTTATLISVFFVVPMWMNFLLRTYAWQVLLDVNGIINGLLTLAGLPKQQFLYTEGAVLLGMVYNFLPFMVLPIYTVLMKLDPSHTEAAADLGANGRQTFFKVVLPLSMPGVVSGITMVFIPAITTFAISQLLGGGKLMMYGDLIENQFLLMQAWGTGSALSFILLILVLISMAVLRFTEGAEQEGGTLW
ncbi:MAG TPA: ABC transporter permease [Clostridia bacterium]|nr:ABC transporter permease [Clostridia bacterium]HOR12450.1 ABC transporter permease [Clostridia bacterium]